MPTLFPFARTSKKLTAALSAIMLTCGLSLPVAAFAKDALTFDGRVEVRAVQSDLDFDEGEDIDSSGVGARGDIGANWQASNKTAVRIAIDASVFDYNDEDRDTLESVGGRLQVTHTVSDEVEVRGYVRRVENIAVLEANSADQTSGGVRLQWEKGNDRLRLTGEYREREYDTTTPAKGDGYRVTAEYSRRFGSYHWLQFRLRHEDMQSDDAARRSYDRQAARVKYSHPIAKRLRLRPSVEYRQWKYDSRIARGDPDGDLRKDSYFAPAIDLSWGRATRGLYALANAEYRIRTSNDERYDSNAIRVGLRVGYRF